MKKKIVVRKTKQEINKSLRQRKRNYILKEECDRTGKMNKQKIKEKKKKKEKSAESKERIYVTSDISLLGNFISERLRNCKF